MQFGEPLMVIRPISAYIHEKTEPFKDPSCLSIVHICNWSDQTSLEMIGRIPELVHFYRILYGIFEHYRDVPSGHP